MNKDKHVYCTNCEYFEINKVEIKNKEIDYKATCIFKDECDISNFEDSMSLRNRPHYNKK